MRLLPLALVAALCTPLSTAHASEGENALSVGLAYGRFSIPSHSPDGGVLWVDYSRGFSETMAVRVSGGGGLYHDGGGEEHDPGQAYTGHLTFGVTYLLDVLQYVPYAQAGVGVMVLGGEEATNIATDITPLLELGVGLDVLRSPRFSWGVQIKFESFIEQTAFFTAGVRGTWRWGFF